MGPTVGVKYEEKDRCFCSEGDGFYKRGAMGWSYLNSQLLVWSF